jgi:5'-3' exoribonuclease 1
MAQLAKAFSEGSDNAKKFYYNEKLKFNIETPEGKVKHTQIVKKYLEGLQWVLHYYYRGVQHWRWFYPFHYAPLISDLYAISDTLLSGEKTIAQYEVDFNCTEENRPYSPF